MTDWNDKLSPLMKEKLAKIGEASPAEREKIKSLEELSTLLADFYAGRVDPDGLWKRFKESKSLSKAAALKEAQVRLLDSLALGTTREELEKRKMAVLAIESLKKQQHTPALEASFSSIDILQKQYKDEADQVYNNIKTQVQRNPQLRMQQVRQGNSMMVVQLPVEEAIKAIPQWRDFQTQHEAKYTEEFGRLIAQTKERIK